MWKQDIDRMLFCIWKGILQTVFKCLAQMKLYMLLSGLTMDFLTYNIYYKYITKKINWIVSS